MLEKMKDYISEQLDCDRDEITLETSFREDLGADSLDLFELVMNLEDEYALEIPPEDLEKMESVGDVVEYLRERGIEEN